MLAEDLFLPLLFSSLRLHMHLILIYLHRSLLSLPLSPHRVLTRYQLWIRIQITLKRLLIILLIRQLLFRCIVSLNARNQFLDLHHRTRRLPIRPLDYPRLLKHVEHLVNRYRQVLELLSRLALREVRKHLLQLPLVVLRLENLLRQLELLLLTS